MNRCVAAFTAIALSSCSLIGTETPPPVETWTKRSDCNESNGRPGLDVAMAATGTAIVGLGALLIVDPNPDASPADASAQPYAGATFILVGAAAMGLFTASAAVGFDRTSRCREALDTWSVREADRSVTEATQRAEAARQAKAAALAAAEARRIKEEAAAAAWRIAVESAARPWLKCPVGLMEHRAILYGGEDQTLDEVVGCSRDAWCRGSGPDDVACGPSGALAVMTLQLAVETGCPVERIEQIERLRLGTQLTYRLLACGNQHSCTTLVDEDRRGPTIVVSKFGSMITCKAAPKP